MTERISDSTAPHGRGTDEHSGGFAGRGDKRWTGKWRGGRALPIRVARDLLTVRRVFGEPIQHGDVTLVPVARVSGGSGYGDGEGSVDGPGGKGPGAGSGSGGGFGVSVTPVGVYVVQGSDVTWQPAFDLNRVVLGGQVVGAIALLALARALRRRRRGIRC